MNVDSFEEVESGGPPNERAWRLARTDGQPAFLRVTDWGDGIWQWDSWIPTTDRWMSGRSDSPTEARECGELALIKLVAELGRA